MSFDHTDFVRAKVHVDYASGHLIVAYWAKASGDNPDYHHQQAIAGLQRAAEILGLDLVKREPIALAPVLGGADFGMKPTSPEPMTAEACNV